MYFEHFKRKLTIAELYVIHMTYMLQELLIFAKSKINKRPYCRPNTANCAPHSVHKAELYVPQLRPLAANFLYVALELRDI